MDIYVFSRELRLLGLLDDLRLCRCILRYDAEGTLTAECVNSAHNRELLREGFFLGLRRDRCLEGLDDPPEELRASLSGRFDGFVLESAEVVPGEEEAFVRGGGEGMLSLTGTGLEALLRLRVIPGRWDVDGDSGAAILSAVNGHCTASAGALRAIPRLEAQSGFTGETVVREGGFETVYEAVQALARAAGTGFSVELAPFAGFLRFLQYRGADRSIPGPRGLLLLAENFGTLRETGFCRDQSGWRTTAYVAGGEENGLRTTEVVENGLSGYERRELWVDAADLRRTRYENGASLTLTEAGYRALLAARGREALSEHTPEERVEASIPETAGLRFRVDYGLGDRVRVRSARFGVETVLPITAVTEFWQEGGYTVSPALGDESPQVLRRLSALCRS